MDSTLFLIPDISGYTKFVTQTEIRHGRHIIRELLEILIESNEMNLTLGEIEGDAILFYKTGGLPGIDRLLSQAKSMFTAFHRHLKKYDSHRICECGACQGAGSLTLKIIAHAGETEFINVKGQQKPYGEHVILAHRLLKNDIESSEYLLLSDQLIDVEHDKISTSEYPWVEMKDGNTAYESLGTINFHYTSLAPLLENLEEPIKEKTSVYSEPIINQILINRPRDEVFERIIDLDQRMEWNNFAKGLEYNKEEINQVGTRHVCVFDSQTIEFESVKANFGKDNLVYGERILDLPFFAKDITIYFVVGAEGQGSRVALQIHYLFKPIIGFLFGPIFRRKSNKTNQLTLADLKAYCERLDSNSS